MDPITIGLVTTAIATPVFTGIYGLGSMIYAYATTAPVTSLDSKAIEPVVTYIASNANALVVRSSGAMVAVQKAAEEILPTCTKLVASNANAVAIRPSNAMVAVKAVVQPICEAIAPQPLMIAPPTAPRIIAENTFLSSNNYTNILKCSYDIYQIGTNLKNGEYLLASAYATGAAIDYALNDTISSAAGHFVENIMGLPMVGEVAKLGASFVTSMLCRTIMPMIADASYQYFYPKQKVKTEETVKIQDKKDKKDKKEIKLSPLNHETQIKPKTNPEVKTEIQTEKKSAVVSSTQPETKKKLDKANRPKRLTGKARDKVRKLEKSLIKLGINEFEAQPEQVAQVQHESKTVQAIVEKADENKNQILNTNSSLISLEAKKIPTPLERKMLRLERKAANEKSAMIHIVAFDNTARELGRKSLKENGCHAPLNQNFNNTGMVQFVSSTLRADNDDLAPLLDGAKFLIDALKDMMTLTKVAPEDNIRATVLKTKKNPYRFDRYDADRNAEAHRSFARMHKAEQHLKKTKTDKYSDADMIKRAEESFRDLREMFEKDSFLMSSMPDSLPRFSGMKK